MLSDQPQPEIARSAVILGEVHVGAGVANGTIRSFLVKAISNGAGGATDAVKATVKVT